ncbi:MAG: methylated-DNA--[protein]-cysteine S-methyltransferase [Dehalococcoidia bacterium]
MTNSQDTLVLAETALGWAGAVLGPNGVRYATLFHTTERAARRELSLAGACEQPDPRADDVADRLRRYALGDGPVLDDYPVDVPAGTPLQRKVWAALRDVPYGETRSYGWLTKHVGEPSGAARAVGAAVGANPIPLWLPCHRVVASTGDLHGFGGGLAMKRRILEVEGALPKSLLPL